MCPNATTCIESAVSNWALPSAVVSPAALEKIKDLVLELTNKHYIDLERPGYVYGCKRLRILTFITTPDCASNLLATCTTEEEYILGFNTSRGPGFQVHYSRNWVPIRAFNNDGYPHRDLASAHEQIVRLVSYYYESDRSLVTELF